MLPLLGAALSGGLSLMSGIGGMQSAKKQAKTQARMDEFARVWNQQEMDSAEERNNQLGDELLNVPLTERSRSFVDVERMMFDANRAGFNPVTWLNAGGMQAYTASETLTTGHNAVAAFDLKRRVPQLIGASTAQSIPSPLSVIGDAGQAALKSYQTDDRLLSSQAFQERLLGIRLNAMQQGTGTAGFGSAGGVVSSGGSTGKAAALSPYYENKPQEVTPSVNGWDEGRGNPSIQYFQTPSGGFMPAMSTKYKEASEDDFLSEIPWHFQNRILPMLGYNLSPPRDMLYGAERWVFNPFTQQYEKTTEPRASKESFDVKVTTVPKDTPNGLSINGYKIWPWW